MPYYNYLGQLMAETPVETGNILGTPAGDETIYAPAGDTSVAGNGGGDLLVGSSGGNRIWFTDDDDRALEQPNGGIDTQIGWMTIKLAPNVENLIVHQDFNHGIGNELGNLMITDGRSWLYGAGGNDVLVGATNASTTFAVHAGEGNDVIYNWHHGDQLQLTGYNLKTVGDVRGAMRQQGSDVILQLSPSETLTFRDTSLTTGFLDKQFLLPFDPTVLGGKTFSDDFNTLSLWDPSTKTGTWQTDFGGNLKDIWAYAIPSNGEYGVYSREGWEGVGERNLHLNPFSVSNGVLSITAQQIPQVDQAATFGHTYATGMVNTLNSFQQKYGYFEIKAQLPNADGSWPAFWMVPWPYQPNHEGDVMESIGLKPGADYRRAYGDTPLYDNALKIDPDGWHTYGMLWTKTELSFYLDGVEVLSGPTPANWTYPMGLIVNMAMGGWGGEANPAEFPATMKVDYVHAYALADGTTETYNLTPAAPTFTIQDKAQPAATPATQTATFDDTGAALSTGKMVVLNHAVTAADVPQTGRAFVIWETGGQVRAAVSNNGYLEGSTTLAAGSASQFSGAGTFLTDGRVVVSYMGTDQGQPAAYALLFDPQTKTFARHELGPSTGQVKFIPMDDGNFAVTWREADGDIMARAFNAWAYDGKGWWGPIREINGDAVGVSANGELVTTAGTVYQITPFNITSPNAVSISSGALSKPEGSSGYTDFTFTVSRTDDGFWQRGTVAWKVTGVGANPTDAADFAGATSGVLSFQGSQGAQNTATITVRVVGDTVNEANEQFQVTLFNPVGTTLGGTVSATGAITNDDSGTTPPPASPQLSLATASLSQAEGSSGATVFSYVVNRSGDASGVSSVNWSVAGSGTNPANGADFIGGNLPTGTLTFAAGETSKTISVNVAGDAANEPNETFTLTLSGAGGATLGTATATGTITNDDAGTPPASPTIAFSTPSVTQNEGASGSTAFSYTVTRSGDTSGASSVNWAVAGSGANPANAADFVGGNLPSGTLNFAAGETSKTVTINVAGDATVEPTETFTVTLSGASGATVGTATAAGTITNDDNSTPPSGSGQTLTSPGPGSSLTGGTGADTLIASQGSDTLTGGGGADVFRLSTEPWSPIHVTDFVVGEDKIDLSALLQKSGYTGSDPIADRYVFLESDGSGGTMLRFDRDGTGGNPQWPNSIIDIKGVAPAGLTWAKLQGAGGTTNPPPTSPQLSLTTPDVTKAEGASGSTLFEYTVTRSGDTSGASSVSWSLAAASGTTTLTGSDFVGGQLPAGTLTFAAGETSKKISFNVAGDTTNEPNESFTINLASPTGATLGTATATGTITNDDGSTQPPPTGSGQTLTSPGPGSSLTGGAGADTLIASQGSDTLTGGGGADVFRLSTEPWSPIHINDFTVGEDKIDLSALLQKSGYTGADPIADRYVFLESDGSGGTMLRFDRDGTGGNPQWPNSIIDLKGVAPAGLTWAKLQGAGGATNPPPTSPQLSLTTADVTKAEGASGSTLFEYTVTRSGDASGASSVSWSLAAASGTTTLTGADFVGGQLPAGTLSFAAGETSKKISFNVAGDTTSEPSESFTISLASPTGATLGTATATGTITNDDGSTQPPPSGSGQTLTSPGPGSRVTGGTGNDTLIASQGNDTLSGGAGADVFRFNTEPWSPIHITDFTPGQDKLDLSALFRASNYSGANPIADRYVYIESDGAGGSVLRFDRDGAGGNPQWPNTIIDLNIAPSQVSASDWIIG